MAVDKSNSVKNDSSCVTLFSVIVKKLYKKIMSMKFYKKWKENNDNIIIKNIEKILLKIIKSQYKDIKVSLVLKCKQYKFLCEKIKKLLKSESFHKSYEKFIQDQHVKKYSRNIINIFDKILSYPIENLVKTIKKIKYFIKSNNKKNIVPQLKNIMFDLLAIRNFDLVSLLSFFEKYYVFLKKNFEYILKTEIGRKIFHYLKKFINNLPKDSIPFIKDIMYNKDIMDIIYGLKSMTTKSIVKPVEVIEDLKSDKSSESVKHKTSKSDKSSESVKHKTLKSDKSSESVKHKTLKTYKSSESVKHKTLKTKKLLSVKKNHKKNNKKNHKKNNKKTTPFKYLHNFSKKRN